MNRSASDDVFVRRPKFDSELQYSRKPVISNQPILSDEFDRRIKRDQAEIEQNKLGGGENVFKIPIEYDDVSLQFLISCIIGGLISVGIYKFIEFKRRLN